MSTETIPGFWKLRAEEHVHAFEMREAEAKEKQRQENTIYRRQLLRKHLLEILALDVEPEGDEIEVDGVLFSLPASYHTGLRMFWTCPRCSGQEFRDVYDLYSVGITLRCWPPYHRCRVAEEELATERRRTNSIVPEFAAPPIPPIQERFISFLRELVRDEVRETLAEYHEG